MTVSDWIIQNWQEALAVVGVGSGSGIIGKKLTDQAQNKKISKLEERVGKVESDLLLNTTMDNEFKISLNARLDRIEHNVESKMEIIINHLLNLKK